VPKFKVGEWLTVFGTDMKYRVLTVIEETCPGGKQIHYVCRAYIRSPYTKKWGPASGKDGVTLQRYNEIELIKYEEPKSDNGNT